MGISFRRDDHAPDHNLSSKKEEEWVDRKYGNKIRVGGALEPCNPKPGREFDMPINVKEQYSMLKPVSFGVPTVLVSSSKENYKISLLGCTKFNSQLDDDVSARDINDFDVDIIFRPLRDYNHKEVIGAHIIFLSTNNGGQPVTRYCDRTKCKKFLSKLFSEVDSYLERHGEKYFT